MQIDELEPGEHTVGVHEIIEYVRSYAQCDLIVCLDSCRTCGLIEDSETWSTKHTAKVEQGSDIRNMAGVTVWYSTQIGDAASDGSHDHSPFTKSLVEALQQKKRGKTWSGLWKEVCALTEERTQSKQLPFQGGAGLGDKKIVPLEIEAVEALQVSLVQFSQETALFF